jgi:transcriptional regulator GlxA family with amidase domain
MKTHPSKTIALVIYQGLTPLDLVGPLQVLSTLILASLGLLQGKPATTHWVYQKFLEQFGARYEHKRWVDNGKIVMSAGVSAGIDWALYLVAKLSDEATARQVQLALQYDPHPPFGRIDWQHLDFLPRVLRLMNSLRAPFATGQAKRMLTMEQKSPS